LEVLQKYSEILTSPLEIPITGIDSEKSWLMSQLKFEKKFGQSPVFIASTLMEDGGIPKGATSASLVKEAIHVISCGYEDKTEWGKEVWYISWLFSWSLLYHMCVTVLNYTCLSGWMDIWFCYRRYINRFQDALSRLAVRVLHA